MWALAVAENRTARDAQLSPEFLGSSEQWESTTGASHHVGNV